MRSGIIIAALLGGCLTAVLGQVAGPEISAYWRATPTQPPDLVKYPASGGYPYQWLHVDSPLSLTTDAANSPHITFSWPQFGPGFIAPLDQSGNLIQLNLDTSYVSYRTVPPTGPGPCVNPISQQEVGSGAWAADSTGLYVCIPNTPTPTPATIWIWAKVPLVTSW